MAHELDWLNAFSATDSSTDPECDARREAIAAPGNVVRELHDTYGTDRANALLSGLVQSVLMRVGDTASIEYARSQIGREQRRRSVPVHGRDGRSIGRQEVQEATHLIAESDLERLSNGEAIVVTADGWARGRLSRFDSVRTELERALEWIAE